MVIEFFFMPPVFAADTDLTLHPLYSTYMFNRDGKHIYFGTQPFSAPEGIIGEVMSHDAILKRNLKKLGIEIVFYPFFNGPDINFFMKQDKLDMAISGDMPTLAIAAEDKAIITGIAKLLNASIVTRRKFGHLLDLKGMRIGVPVGTSAHLGLLTVLAAANMTNSDVQIVPMRIGELTAALEENRIAAFSAWEPTPSAALTRNKDFVVIHRFLNSSYLYQSKLFAERNPEASLQLHASFLRALRWMNESVQNMQKGAEWAAQTVEKRLGKKLNLTPDQIASIANEGIDLFARFPTIPRSDFRQNGFLFKAFNFLNENGKLPAESSWEKILRNMDSRILRTLLAQQQAYDLDSYEPD